MKVLRFWILALVMLTIAACAAPSVRYYTLRSATVLDDAATPASTAAAAPFAISVQSVEVPIQVERPQIVLTLPGSAEVVPLNDSLWASPLAQEIQASLGDHLSQQLNALDVGIGPAAYKLPLWKIAVHVKRFESLYRQAAILEASWRLTPVNVGDADVRLCAAEIHIPAKDSVGSMVGAHQAAIHQLALLISATLQSSPSSSSVNRTVFKGCVG